MKKLFIVLLAAFFFAVVNPTKSEAKVMYDGAEVVKGQIGKMTFKKDIKVYKKNPDGSFDSLMVKRNNFFRTYDIEKYDDKTFYQMGQYRVQATDLVVFKEVPIDIRASFYNNPAYVNINHQGLKFEGVYNLDYGELLTVGKREDACRPKIFVVSIGKGKLNYHLCAGDIEGEDVITPGILDSTDIRIFEKTIRNKGSYILTEDTEQYSGPMITKYHGKELKGTVFYSPGIEINGYLMVGDVNFGFIPANLLKPVEDK
ncbi:hypothetical protein [Lysinibacillus xylanilyticus]|uniref:hypothetical protein n=1 Tax=Lysinibacillus xylanilyticus TaxID=582475 RepID=UPI003D0244E4